jgi:hypothetical protein
MRKALDDIDAFVAPRQPRLLRIPPEVRHIYYEVMDYNKLLRDAEKRNRIFFDKLNIIGKT